VSRSAPRKTTKSSNSDAQSADLLAHMLQEALRKQAEEDHILRKQSEEDLDE
jgi:hypothetical protein